jgi:hypothetical protein
MATVFITLAQCPFAPIHNLQGGNTTNGKHESREINKNKEVKQLENKQTNLH